MLAEAGAAPILLERGRDSAARLAAIEKFHKTRLLDPDSNIQFGEGGAGTFSDGKLTTNIHDPRCAHVLDVFVQAGAPEEILWQAKPHIGTDLLPGVIQNVRRASSARAGTCGLRQSYAMLYWKTAAFPVSWQSAAASVLKSPRTP